jgi:hypothetical protein
MGRNWIVCRSTRISVLPRSSSTITEIMIIVSKLLSLIRLSRHRERVMPLGSFGNWCLACAHVWLDNELAQVSGANCYRQRKSGTAYEVSGLKDDQCGFMSK